MPRPEIVDVLPGSSGFPGVPKLKKKNRPTNMHIPMSCVYNQYPIIAWHMHCATSLICRHCSNENICNPWRPCSMSHAHVHTRHACQWALYCSCNTGDLPCLAWPHFLAVSGFTQFPFMSSLLLSLHPSLTLAIAIPPSLHLLLLPPHLLDQHPLPTFHLSLPLHVPSSGPAVSYSH